MYEQIKLPYQYGDLEPVLNADTVETHYSKHHATYAKNFNDLVAQAPELSGKTLEEILGCLDKAPEKLRQGIRNNGGGLYNHNLYFEQLSPMAKKEPTGELAEKIRQTFDSLEECRKKLAAAAVGQFGSGYGWLVRNGDGSLEIVSTANQDCPLSCGQTPILTIDVWEHAYYLGYKNLRADYVNKLFDIIDWQVAEDRYAGCCQQK